MLNGMTTRSPVRRLVIAGPTSSTMPIGSWPRMSPSVMKGPSTSYRCRSEPQMPLDVTRMTMSSGSWMAGSGTFSTRTSRRPCQVTAFMSLPPVAPPKDPAARPPSQGPTRRVCGETRQLGLGDGVGQDGPGWDGTAVGRLLADGTGPDGTGPDGP